jgi:hypothetical protein
MYNKITNTLICLLFAAVCTVNAQPVKQWQDRNGEWHFGDPRAAPTRGSSDVKIQQPISLITNDQPLPDYKVNNSTSKLNMTQRRSAVAPPQPPARRSKADCASLRESLKLTPARQQQHQQRQQQYERECVIGVYYADSQ